MVPLQRWTADNWAVSTRQWYPEGAKLFPSAHQSHPSYSSVTCLSPSFLSLLPFANCTTALPLNWIPLVFSFFNSPKQCKHFKNKLNSVGGYTVKSRVHLLYLHLFRNTAYAMAIKHGHKLLTPLSEWWSLYPSPWIWASFWVQQPT